VQSLRRHLDLPDFEISDDWLYGRNVEATSLNIKPSWTARRVVESYAMF